MENTSTLSVKVLYFSSIREALGGLSSESVTLEEGKKHMNFLVDEVKERHKDNEQFLLILSTSMLARNNEYVFDLSQEPLLNNDEVAVIPPISGG